VQLDGGSFSWACLMCTTSVDTVGKGVPSYNTHTHTHTHTLSHTHTTMYLPCSRACHRDGSSPGRASRPRSSKSPNELVRAVVRVVQLDGRSFSWACLMCATSVDTVGKGVPSYNTHPHPHPHPHSLSHTQRCISHVQERVTGVEVLLGVLHVRGRPSRLTSWSGRWSGWCSSMVEVSRGRASCARRASTQWVRVSHPITHTHPHPHPHSLTHTQNDVFPCSRACHGERNSHGRASRARRASTKWVSVLALSSP